MIRHYRIHNIIGYGSYGTVYKAEHIPTKKQVALKDINISDLSTDEINRLVNEISIQKCNTSDYIIKYYDSFVDNEHVYIISELAINGDLQTLVRKKHIFTDSFISKIIIQISLGLNYLHKHNIIHRDLKTSNIFFNDKWDVKIGDLGIAKFFSDYKFTTSLIGSPCYMSPEMYDTNGYDEKVDMWSLGCILYNMLTLEHPFKATNIIQLVYIINNYDFKKISDNNTNYHTWNSILTSLLNKNPKERLDALALCKNDFLIKSSNISNTIIDSCIYSNNKISENLNNIYKDISGTLEEKINKIHIFHLKNTIKLPSINLLKHRNSEDIINIKYNSLTHRKSDSNIKLPPLTHR
jgi:serine/threonine protein kinase